MTNVKYRSNGILYGSSRISSTMPKIEQSREGLMVELMDENSALQYFIKIFNGSKEKAVKHCRDRYIQYRRLWKNQIDHYASAIKIDKNNVQNFLPLCIDIEVASICDLACKFCYREVLPTPDKIMSMELFRQIADQASALGIPSAKLNWRGEPLMNPHLPEMVRYLKNKGFLEVIINTNATHLTQEMSEKLIEAGLDLMIYSFDGGTKETYEKNRPGRFKTNNFENVYSNIRNFSQVRKDKKRIFLEPRSR